MIQDPNIPVPPGPEAVEKLELVLSFLEQEPRRLNMATWGIVGASPEPLKKELDRQLCMTSHPTPGGDFPSEVPPCNTVGCLAGASLIVSGAVRPETLNIAGRFKQVYTFDSNAPHQAADWLGIDYPSAERLFLLRRFNRGNYHWPPEFEQRLNQTQPGTPEYFQVTKERVRHFEKTGE